MRLKQGLTKEQEQEVCTTLTSVAATILSMSRYKTGREFIRSAVEELSYLEDELDIMMYKEDWRV